MVEDKIDPIAHTMLSRQFHMITRHLDSDGKLIIDDDTPDNYAKMVFERTLSYDWLMIQAMIIKYVNSDPEISFKVFEMVAATDESIREWLYRDLKKADTSIIWYYIFTLHKLLELEDFKE